MKKLVLYIFDGGEPEDIIEGVKEIKKFIKKYEDNTKGTPKKVGRNSKQIRSFP